jgi:CheY-like chemotaxis protein
LQGHFLSAKKGEEDIKKDFHLGANLYVTKAIFNKKLVEQVQELIRY